MFIFILHVHIINDNITNYLFYILFILYIIISLSVCFEVFKFLFGSIFTNMTLCIKTVFIFVFVFVYAFFIFLYFVKMLCILFDYAL